MKFLRKASHSDKITEAKHGLIVSFSMVGLGCLLWFLAYTYFPDRIALMFVPFLLVIGGAYLLWQTVLFAIIDMSIGRRVFFIGFGILTLLGGVMSLFQGTTTP